MRLKKLAMEFLLAIASIVGFLPAIASAEKITWICSTADKPWQVMPVPALVAGAGPAEIRILPEKAFQTIDGFGGCFNELGWIAIVKLSPEARERTLKSLFSPDSCNFNLGRIPIGASDFAAEAYSLDDTAGDLELKEFSIERDKTHLLPYIKSAMQIRPDLSCWGSPWSPPAWMKTNNHFSAGELKWEKPILSAYANYLARFVETYRAQGVNIYAITPQNEPNITNVYPTCLWTGEHLREFIADYLGPTLRDRKTNVQLWLGFNGDPPNRGDNINDRFFSVFDDPVATSFLTGFAFQYDSKNQIAIVHQLCPDKKLMQSETVCYGGDNSWADALKLFQLMKRYFDNGANAYFAWNMVLDETGTSTWKWKQNSLITVNTNSPIPGNAELRFNGEYHVMRHFSQFVHPGARRVLTAGIWGDKIGFVNPDGSIVLVVANSSDKPYSIPIRLRGAPDANTLIATIPAKSLNTIVVH